MSRIAFVILSVAVTMALGKDGDIPPGPGIVIVNTTSAPITITTPSHTTTSKPITVPTTKSTTTPPSTTTTPKPTTTTTTATTTTASTTTASTTTAKTTTAAPTPPTTPKPMPNPGNPQAGTWVANYTGTNNTCIVAHLAIQLQINYEVKNTSFDYIANVPSDAKSDGSCGKDKQSITLKWNENNTIPDQVTFTFMQNVNESKVYLYSVGVTLNLTTNNSILHVEHRADEFTVPLRESYRCWREQKLNLTVDNSNHTEGYIHISQVQLQAFRNATNKAFDQAVDCPGATKDIVPIAVGCALAVLVIIILVGYLIGRRRSQARGYLSMFTETKREEDYIPMKNLSCFK